MPIWTLFTGHAGEPFSRVRRIWVGVLLAAVAAYAASCLVRTLVDDGAGRISAFDDWLYNGIVLGCAALVWTRVAGDRRERRVWLAAAIGLTLQCVVGTAFSLERADILTAVTAPVQKLAFAAYAAYYVALVGLLKLRVTRLVTSVWLDGIVVALGIATVAAAFLLQPIAERTASDGATVAGALAFPLSDLVLLLTVGVSMALLRRKVDATWLLLAGGVSLYAVADSYFAFALASGTYVEGSIVDAGWPAGATLLTLAALTSSGRVRAQVAVVGRALLAVPAIATAGATTVLVLDHALAFEWYVPALAAATLVAAGLRTALAFREVNLLGDSRRQAVTDDLTGLANRRLLMERLAAALAGQNGRKVGLLLIDLDRFKEVNDALGHAVGDELLRRLGPRLAARARPQDTVARLGGDEFAVLLDPMPDSSYAEEAAKLVQDALAEPIQLDGLEVRIGASIGIAVGPDHGADAGELLRSADVAMYEAKGRRIGHRLYDPILDGSGRDRLRTVAELRAALVDGGLDVYYQPKLRLDTGAVDGIEALVRWQHPTRGLLLPGAFLPIAEQANLMRPLTLTILDRALADCAAWRAAGDDAGVAVNVSASGIVDPLLAGYVDRLLQRHGLPGSALQIEITETALADDADSARSVLAALRALGVGLAIDDYGAGYSSLAYLRDLSVDELKLDRSFVTGLADDATERAIVRSTVDLAHALGLRMVAEGVESEADWHELRELGCDLVQGYYIARPMPIAALREWLPVRRIASAA